MDLLNHLFRPPAAPAWPKGEEAEVPSPIAEPSDDQAPRSPAASPAVKNAPPPSAPARPSGEMVLQLGDVLARVPTDALQSALHDPELELRFSVEDLLPGFSRGRAAIPLSLLAARYPDVFRTPGTAARETNVYLPMQKLMQQIGQNGAVTARQEAPAPVASAQAPAPPPPEPAPSPAASAPPVVEAPPAETRPEALVVEEPKAAPVPEPPSPFAPPPAPVSAPAMEEPPPIPPPVPTPPTAPLPPESGVRIQRGPPHIRPPFLSGPSGPSPVVMPPKNEPPPSPVAIPPLNFGPAPAQPAPVPPPEAPSRTEPAAPAIPPIGFAPPAEPPVTPPEPAVAETPAPPEAAAEDDSITVTPAPVPSDSAPATVPQIDYFLDQEPLQAIFMTDEAMDLQRVSDLSAHLPGITGCMVLAGKSFTQGGERPAGLDAGTLRELSGKLAGTLETFQEALPAEPTFTLYGGNRALSIFARGEISLCVVHAPRGFLPGVRERLGAVADILARCLPEAEGDEEQEEMSPGA